MDIDKKYPVFEFGIDKIHVVYKEVFQKWCGENCAAPFYIKNTNTTFDNNAYIKIVFTTEEDAMAFKLRWL